MMAVMENLRVPPEFNRLALAFRFESPEGLKDQRDWIASILRHLDSRSRHVVRQFLADLLSKDIDEKELQKLWNSTGSGYYIVGKGGNDGVRCLLTMIRDQIE